MPSCQHVATSLSISTPLSEGGWTLADAQYQDPGHQAIPRSLQPTVGLLEFQASAVPAGDTLPTRPFTAVASVGNLELETSHMSLGGEGARKGTCKQVSSRAVALPSDKFQIPWHGPKSAGSGALPVSAAPSSPLPHSHPARSRHMERYICISCCPWSALHPLSGMPTCPLSLPALL